jgi:para-aminobenzoate synthetase component 1
MDDPVRDQAVQQDLLNSEKDRAENLMIVDLLRNDLGRVSITGSVKTESLFKLHSFTHVHHLISTVSAQLPEETSPLSVMQSCFPGGSITGAPKIRAMQIIAQLEKVPRTVYCGSIFYCDYLNRMDSSILIRTLLSTQEQLFCWGGSGVVADSVMAEEYQECLDKVSALMNLPLV